MTGEEAERKFRWVGTRPVRPDGPDKVTGRARYGADFSLPGMLWGSVLRSPHAHARVLSIDASEALALDGVHAVVTADDIPDPSESGVSSEVRDISRNVMARDKVLYNGHALAAVAAHSPALARAALERIRVEYEVLDPVLEIDQALAPGAPLLHEELRTRGQEDAEPSNLAAEIKLGHGDVEAGFAEADEIVEREFTTQGVHQGYIEPHACLAQAAEDGKITLWVSSQGQFAMRSLTAGVLAIDLSRIRVIPAEIGGGFGGKTTIYLEPVAVALARKSGRPVKMVMSREEVFRASGPVNSTRIKVKLGATRDGRLTAAEATLHYEAGGFPGSSVQAGAMTIFSSYALEHVRITGYDVVVNKPKGAAYRAPGAPMAAFAAESVLDELAQRLEIDPVDFRLHNAAKEGTRAAFGPRLDRKSTR
ncbi:MAG: xanthine dehydrogenase family protein molybdopterin-binding subunit, partial [Myxococcota bacterium]